MYIYPILLRVDKRSENGIATLLHAISDGRDFRQFILDGRSRIAKSFPVEGAGSPGSRPQLSTHQLGGADFACHRGRQMEPFEADTLLLNRDEFFGSESEPLSECPIRLTREEIVAGAIADAGRGTKSTIVVLQADLNNSVRLHHARVKMEYSTEQLDELAAEMMIGKSKASELWQVASYPGYIARIWSRVAKDRAACATRGKHGLEFRARGWKYYFDLCLKENGIEREKKKRASQFKFKLEASIASPSHNKVASKIAETPGERAAATTAEFKPTILARLAASERELEQKNAELAASRAEIERLKAEIERLRHGARVASEAGGIVRRGAVNDIGPAPANDADSTSKAFAQDQAADQDAPADVARRTAETLPASHQVGKEDAPPKRGRGRPRINPSPLKLSAAQQKALAIAEARSTLRWDDEVRAVTKKTIESRTLVEFDDDGCPSLTDDGRVVLDQIRKGGSARPLA